MKKKILLALMLVLVLVCIFAISVSAAEIPEWTEITEVDGMADKSVFGADGTKGATSRVLMSDGKTYPAYYICKNSTSLGFDYKELSTNSGTTYTAVNVVRLEVPMGVISSPQAVLKTENKYTSLKTVSLPEGFTTLNGYTFYGKTAYPSVLVKVDLPSTLTKVGAYEFLDCGALEELVIPDGVTVIGENFAKNTTSLKKLVLPASLKQIEKYAFRSSGLAGVDVVIPEGCTTIGTYAFAGTNIKSVTLPYSLTTVESHIFAECHSLTDVYSNSTIIGAHMFFRCENVKNVVLKNTVTIGNNAFNNDSTDYGNRTTKIVNLVLPNSVTSIGNYAFTRCDITEIVIPAGTTTIGISAFNGCASLKKAVVLGPVISETMFQYCYSLNELVLTENIETMGKQCIGEASKTQFTTYYTGTDYERVRTLALATGVDRISASKTATCTYEDYVNGNYTAKTFTYIYDINLCVAAFDGVHTEPQDDGDCTTAVLCAYCKEHTFKEALSHIVSERLTYASLLENGEYYHGCTNDGCTNGVITVVAPLFECLGYSMPESSVGSVAIGFKANATEIDEYERVNKTTVSYGLFAVSQQKLGENQIFDGNGKASDGVINVDTSRHAFNWFELKIVGFNEENKDNKLALGAYMLAKNEDGIKCFYMQEGTPTDGMSYFFDSYSGILASIKK